ncbi:MAG: hypothetical protein K9M44_04860 [Candidatus Pacebacteria bacterium]|nr:hypothetical protein [Candidatus Paceibacterota bacterium]
MNTLNGWGIFSIIALIIIVISIISLYSDIKKEKLKQEAINKEDTLFSKICLWYLLGFFSLIVLWQIMGFNLLVFNAWGIGSLVLMPVMILIIIFANKSRQEEKKRGKTENAEKIVIMSVLLVIGLTISYILL